MTEEEIRQAMEYCYEAKPAECSVCPLYSKCMTMDADTLGEIFASMVKEGSQNNDIQGKRSLAEQSI